MFGNIIYGCAWVLDYIGTFLGMAFKFLMLVFVFIFAMMLIKGDYENVLWIGLAVVATLLLSQSFIKLPGLLMDLADNIKFKAER